MTLAPHFTPPHSPLHPFTHHKVVRHFVHSSHAHEKALYGVFVFGKVILPFRQQTSLDGLATPLYGDSEMTAYPVTQKISNHSRQSGSFSNRPKPKRQFLELVSSCHKFLYNQLHTPCSPFRTASCSPIHDPSLRISHPHSPLQPFTPLSSRLAANCSRRQDVNLRSFMRRPLMGRTAAEGKNLPIKK